MRLAFFGTPDFAVPTLGRLLDGRHEVVAVVTQPDRPRGRGRAVHPSPVAERALAAGVPLLRPERVGEAGVVEALRSHAPDLGVVVAFGQFLPKPLRELPARGYLINAHASLLPRHRGAAPIAHALLAGDRETGVSVMKVVREMDAGPVALVKTLAIAPDDDAGSLARRLAALAADAIAEGLEQIEADRVDWTPQDERRATLAPKIERADAHIDWSEPAERIRARIRAMAPSPGAWTEWEGGWLRILAADTGPGEPDRPPGTLAHREGALRVATGRGWLLPRRIQRAGGKVLDVESYLRGRALPDGAHFGA